MPLTSAHTRGAVVTTAPTIVPIRTAAERLGVHENTIRNWIDKEIIEHFRLPSGVRRIPEREVKRLEAEMFAVPSSFPEDEITKMPRGIHEDTLESYPEF